MVSEGKKKKRRPLHFALSGALLVPGLIGAACGPEEEGPNINVPAPEPEPTGNPVGEEPPPEVQETANPVAEDPPEVVDPPVNPAAEPPPPEPTPNPSGD
jgi:outer membrane biosynthesis protein TonB